MQDDTIASKSTPGSTSPHTVYRQAGDRGPRHKRFPEINVALTAKACGISKSQLSRLLNGQNKPGLESLKIVAGILGKTVEETVAVYDAMGEGKQKTKTKKKAKSKPKKRK